MSSVSASGFEHIRGALQTITSAAEKARVADFKALLWQNAESIRKYLYSFRLKDAPDGLIEAYVNDALARFLRTLEFVPLPCTGSVLEIGSNPYLFHLLLHKFFPRAHIRGTNFFDQNIFSTEVKPFSQSISSAKFNENHQFESTLLNLETVENYPFPDKSFDLIFFCETLEHLIIDPLAVFKKLRRLLSNDGRIIITLPNAVRLTNVALMLDGYNFFDLYSVNGINGRHNREYTLAELVYLLRQNGYQILRAETYDRFDYDLVDIWTSDYTGVAHKSPRRKSDVVKFLKRAGGALTDRGDNLYVLASA